LQDCMNQPRIYRIVRPFLKSGGWKTTTQIQSRLEKGGIIVSKKFLLLYLNAIAEKGNSDFSNGVKQNTWIL